MTFFRIVVVGMLVILAVQSKLKIMEWNLTLLKEKQ
jgi:hypothetical protein